jgi:very-short-patch-repair endonuclease
MQEVKLSTQRARTLRKNMTEAERKLWGRLREQQLGIRFRRQVVLGRYIVDFACLTPKIIIEVDGSQHADNLHYDEQRTKWLESLGYRVLRYWNNEVLNNLDAVLDAIWRACFDTPPSGLRPPSPAGKAS